MRYAICNEMFQGWEIEKVFQYAGKLGYHGVEIAPFTLADDCRRVGDARKEAIRRAAKDNGVEIVGLHWLLVKPEGLHLNSPEAGIRKRTEEYLEALIAFCSELGGRVCVFGSPKQRNVVPPEPFLDAWRRTVDAFARLAETALRRGVTIAFEPLTARETNFVNTAAEGSLLVRDVCSPAFQLHLDVKAMFGEGRPVADTIRLEGGRSVAHVHVNDPNLRGPGMGELDFAPIAAALKDVGYDGYLSVEVFDYKPGPEATAVQSLETLRKHFGAR
jgi:sugar phosphate isomerase/epimerase